MNKLTDKELIEELKIRMVEKTNAFEELKMLNQKLEESEKLKSHFISNITNEIVNPFSSIIGLSKSILSVDKENWKKVLSMVALIHSEAFSLDFQLKNIFAAAAIEAGELLPETGKVNIPALVRSVTDSFRIEAQKKNISFNLAFYPSQEDENLKNFVTDPEKLKLIFSNLLNNAIKFASDKSPVTVNIKYSDCNLILSVMNKGIEITEEQKEFIFDRFRRADPEITSVNRGHGLGLSVIRSLLDLLGGEISFRSNSHLGTVFTISLPEAPGDQNSFLTSADGNELFFDDNQVF